MIKRLSTVLAMAAVGWALASAPVAAQINARLGHGGSDIHPFHIWSVKFAEEAGRLTNGRLKVAVYPNSQLGKEREMAEGLRLGTLEMTVVGTGTILPEWVPEIGVLDLPFIYRDFEHFYAVQDGAVGEELKKKLEAKGMRHIGWSDIGQRHMTNNVRPLRKPEDLAGLKMRVPNSKVYIQMMRSLGATVVPVNFAELYLALQQGVVDGQENPTTTIRTMNYFEVQKFVSLTGHIFSGASGLVSTEWFNRQPADIKTAIVEAGKLATTHTRAWTREDNAKSLAFLKERGMQVNEVDGEAFRKSMTQLYAEMKDVFPPTLIQRIIDTK